jgi:putative SOS response-associated peptidase YedK
VVPDPQHRCVQRRVIRDHNTRLAPSYNTSPESIQPIVQLDKDTGERVLALTKWGLVPYWILLANSIFLCLSADIGIQTLTSAPKTNP